MAAVKKQYDYSDFISLIDPYTRPDLDKLKDEIQNSTITIALDHIDADDGTEKCDVWFKDDISAGEETTLEGIVGSHTGEPMNPEPETQPVTIRDVADLDPTRARTKVKGFNFDAPAGDWGEQDLSLPYKINVLCGEGYTGFAEDGDKFEFIVGPDTAVGQVTEAKASGQTEIPVSATVIANILAGFWVRFALDPGNPGDATEHEVMAVDSENSKITISPALTADVTTNHYVLMSVKYAEDIELQTGEGIDIGGKAAGSSSVPANTVMRARYYNAGASAKRVRLRLTFKYGGGNSN